MKNQQVYNYALSCIHSKQIISEVLFGHGYYSQVSIVPSLRFELKVFPVSSILLRSQVACCLIRYVPLQRQYQFQSKSDKLVTRYCSPMKFGLELRLCSFFYCAFFE